MDIRKKLKCLVYNNYSINEIGLILGIDSKIVLSLLKECDIDVKTYNNFLKYNGLVEPLNVHLDDNNIKSICLVSDLHYCSVNDRPDLVKEIYTECKKRHIHYILCSGDLTNGHYAKRENYKNDNKVLGVQNTINYVVNEHPYCDNIEFYTIGGNHDNSFWRNDGVDIIENIANIRKDIHYLGYNAAFVNFGNNKIYLNHGYYKGQKSYDARFRYYYNKANDKSVNIVSLGHIHTSYYTKINGVYMFQVGSIQDLIRAYRNSGYDGIKSYFILNFEYDENNDIRDVLVEEIILENNKVRCRK